ncbi:MAG: metallophosphoesterase, partial [Candidatus Omnitrophica bacterium]|nr:metallophosphoesterase [Candidatus Omnitrophota bacterium]
MMRTFIFFVLTLSLPFLAMAETAGPKITIDVEEGANPWNHLEFHNDPNNFQFAIVTDRTGGHRPGIFEDAMIKLNLLQPEFVMSIGDLIEGENTPEKVEHEWDEFTGFIDNLQMPFFYVPGNHDIKNDMMAKVWKKRFGRAYHHFVYKDVLFLCVNSEDPKFHIGDEQIAYFKKALEENPDVRWTLAFLHRPFWGYSQEEIEESNWDDFSALLQGRKHTVFAGHWHDYVKYVRNDMKHIVLATTGGGSRLRGPAWGEFDHVVWVTMTNEGPVIANLMLEGIWDENVRTEDMAESTQNVFRGMAVRGGSVILEDPSAGKVTTQVRIENTADVPMKIAAKFEPHSILSVDNASFELTVPPNSMEDHPVTVSWKEPGSLAGAGPLTLLYTITYQFPNHQPIDMEGKHAITIDQVFSLPEASQSVTVDGDLSEWGEFPFAVQDQGQVYRGFEGWNGPEDSSFQFAVKQDKGTVYLAIKTVDDILIFNPDRSPDDKDSVEVWIDARPEAERSKGIGSEEKPEFLKLAVTLSDNPDEMILVEDSSRPEGVEFASSKHEGYFDLEIGIPQKVFDSKQGGEWKTLRLNVGQNDRDMTGRVKSLWWRPYWRSA